MVKHPVRWQWIRWQWIVALFVLPTTSYSYTEAALDCYRAFSSESWTDAGVYCEQAAGQGDAEAQFKLASMLAQGDGQDRNLPESARWLEAAARQGHLEANYNLGIAYERGNGVPRDLARAAELYRVSGNQGHAKSQRDLAYLYERGEGVAQDFGKAFLWHRASAESGLVRGQLKTGLMLIEGDGTSIDREAGIAWLHRAADKGDADAQFVLGVLLREENPSASQRWLQRAADQNQRLALHQLAAAMAGSDNVSTLAQARQYADRAVRAGHLDSVALVEALGSRITSLQSTETVQTRPTGERQELSGLAGGSAFEFSTPHSSPVTRPAAPVVAVAAAQGDHGGVTRPATLDARPATLYTIQLISLSSESKVLKFISDYHLEDAAHYHRTTRNDTTFFRVTYGEYQQRQEAQAGIRELPTALQKLKPMVKSVERQQMTAR